MKQNFLKIYIYVTTIFCPNMNSLNILLIKYSAVMIAEAITNTWTVLTLWAPLSVNTQHFFILISSHLIRIV